MNFSQSIGENGDKELRSMGFQSAAPDASFTVSIDSNTGAISLKDQSNILIFSPGDFHYERLIHALLDKDDPKGTLQNALAKHRQSSCPPMTEEIDRNTA